MYRALALAKPALETASRRRVLAGLCALAAVWTGVATAEASALEVEGVVLVVIDGDPNLDTADALARVVASALPESLQRSVLLGPELRAAIEQRGLSWRDCARSEVCGQALAREVPLVLRLALSRHADGYRAHAFRDDYETGLARRWRHDEVFDISDAAIFGRRVARECVKETTVLTVRVDEPGGVVRVDGVAYVEVGSDGMTSRALVPIGRHEVEWWSASGQRVGASVRCASGRPCSLQLELSPLEVDDSGSAWITGFTYGSLAGASTAAAVGIGLGYRAKHLEKSLNDACGPAGCRLSEDEMDRRRARGRRLTTTANALLGVAAGLAVVTLGLFLDDVVGDRQAADGAAGAPGPGAGIETEGAADRRGPPGGPQHAPPSPPQPR